MRRVWKMSLIALLAAWYSGLNPALADGFIVIHNPPPSHSPVPHYIFAPLEVKFHNVTVKIRNQVALTEVDESFYNPNNQRLEGTYIFPVPKGAQIDSLSMDINGKMMDAELLDADKARGIYEDIVRQMKDPALLEYSGQSMFKLRIFPIEPHSEKHIKLKYTQVLKSDSGLVEYLYPLNTEKFSSVPVKNVSVKVDLESKKGIRMVYSPSHDVEIKNHDRNHATIGYEATNTKPDTDFQLFYSANTDSDIGLDLMPYNDGTDDEGGYFMLMISPAAEMAKEKIAAKDVVFVLDTSGSMADNHKLEQARKALLFCMRNLNDDDRFEILRFSTETEPLFGELKDVNEKNRTRAEKFISGLKPIGGTAIKDALLKAIDEAGGKESKGRPFMIVFITDGKPTVGETGDDAITTAVMKRIKDRPIRIFSFGVGSDINTHLLDQITEKTRAASQYILPTEDIEVKVSNFYTKINEPMLTDLKLDFSGAIRTTKVFPSELPDLFRGEQIAVVGRYTGSGDVAVTLKGAVNGETRTFTYETTFPKKNTELAFVPRLWATRRVGFLLDQIRLHGDNTEVRDEVTQLARKYGIVTPYTSFLIVEDESRRNIPVLTRSLSRMEAPAVREEVTRMYSDFDAKSGDDAVGSAQAVQVMKYAKKADKTKEANSMAKRGQTGANAAGGDKVQGAIDAQQNRFIAGRTFYQNGNQWVDSNVQSRQDARKVQVQFNSKEYFALLNKHANAAQWLSVGRNVQVLLGDTVYEIVD